MQENQDWTSKYFSPEAQKFVAERQYLWNPELQARASADWEQLYADVQSAIDRKVKPDSEESQALAARWSELVERFTGGNPAVSEGLKKLYADRINWPANAVPAEARKEMPAPRLMAFVQAAQRCA